MHKTISELAVHFQFVNLANIISVIAKINVKIVLTSHCFVVNFTICSFNQCIYILFREQNSGVKERSILHLLFTKLQYN